MAFGFELDALRRSTPAILPSMLLCDFGNLEREVAQLFDAKVPGFHLDVMDGRFVPNLTYGMPIVKAIRELTSLVIDVHLMIDDPGRYVEEFSAAGADVLTIHVEATDHPAEVLADIRDRGMAAGLALNPATPLEAIDDCLPLCDLVLVMSVPAGFGGQPFDASALDKLVRLKQMVTPGTLLQVDGGIKAETIGRCAEAGAELFVVGSAIFGGSDYAAVVADLRNRAQQELKRLSD